MRRLQPFSRRWLIPFVLAVLLVPSCGDTADDSADTTSAPTTTTPATTATAAATTTATAATTTTTIEPTTTSATAPAASPKPWRWVSSPLEPQIAVTFADEGWTAVDYGCDGLLDYATFRHDRYGGSTAALYVGPIHQDCSWLELVADLPTIDSPPVQVEIGVGDWYALVYEESLPDWSYLGVRLGPSSRGSGHLYLIEGDERNYFAFITARGDRFEDFAAIARTVLESLELDVGPVPNATDRP